MRDSAAAPYMRLGRLRALGLAARKLSSSPCSTCPYLDLHGAEVPWHAHNKRFNSLPSEPSTPFMMAVVTIIVIRQGCVLCFMLVMHAHEKMG